MAAIQLSTDRQLAGLRPMPRRYEVGIASSQGLALRVHPTGLKQFEFRYVATNGKRRRLILGSYPDLSLSEARDKMAALRVSVRDGLDPVGAKLAEKERARTGETLDELAEAYWAAAVVGLHGGRKRPKRALTIVNERRLWTRHIRKALGDRPFLDIKRSELKIYMRAFVLAGSLSAASIASIGALLHGVFAYAVQEERLEFNPMHGLARPIALTSRDRMFSDGALREIWDAAVLASTPRAPGEKTSGVHARLEPTMGLAIQLLMLTLTRRNEVAGALKAEFDLEARHWTIPSDRAKGRHPHVVPLTADALVVLEEAWAHNPDSPYVFASERVAGQPLEARAITRAFSRTCIRRKLPPGSPHDVRRTGATTLTGRYGVTRFLVGLLLAHEARDGAAVTSVYDRHTYLPEKREALEKWAGHLTGRVTVGGASEPVGATPSGVVGSAALARPDDEGLGVARRHALDLCAAGDLHHAVLSMSMSMSRRPDMSVAHLDILAGAGLELARSGARSRVEAWINGFG